MFTKIRQLFTSPKSKWFFITVLCAAFTLFPFFETKLVTFLVVIYLCISNLDRIRKALVGVILAILFAYAYINTPYWQVVPDLGLKILVLFALIVTGGVWAYVSASDIRVRKMRLSGKALVVLTASIVVVQYRPLIIDIAWRGDENIHIFFLMHLVSHIRNVLHLDLPLYAMACSLSILAVLFTVSYIVFRRIQKKATYNTFTKIILMLIGSSIALLPAVTLFNQALPTWWTTDTLSLYNMVRWPFIQKWVNLAFLYPQMSYDIRLYRIIPLLCTVFIGWYIYGKFNDMLRDEVTSVLLAFAFVTIPVLYFYGTIVYLEMPVVLFLTYCVFNIRDVLFAEAKVFTGKPVWYALILLGFLKETVLIILLIMFVLRFTVQMIVHRFALRVLLSELKHATLAAFPLIVYLLFRKYYISGRPYYFEIHNLLDLTNYRLVGEALFRQMGVFTILSLAGFAVVVKSKEKIIPLALFMLFIGITVFFMVDSHLYMGYSRWNLYSVPIVLYLSYKFFIFVKRPILLLCLAALFAGNYLLNPIMPDGVRISNWGCPNTDGAEYYYPYEKAIKYLQSDPQVHSVLLLGQYFPYWGLQFYQNKYDFHPKIQTIQFSKEQPFGVLSFDGRRFDKEAEWNYLSAFLNNCTKPGSETATIDAIIYHSVNNIDWISDDMYCGKFKIRKRIENSLHSLYILQ